MSMETVKLIAVIDARFKSGNAIPVERAHIKASEWAAIRNALCEAERAAWKSAVAAIK